MEVLLNAYNSASEVTDDPWLYYTGAGAGLALLALPAQVWGGQGHVSVCDLLWPGRRTVITLLFLVCRLRPVVLKGHLQRISIKLVIWLVCADSY